METSWGTNPTTYALNIEVDVDEEKCNLMSNYYLTFDVDNAVSVNSGIGGNASLTGNTVTITPYSPGSPQETNEFSPMISVNGQLNITNLTFHYTYIF